jgi:hypothetical protein
MVEDSRFVYQEEAPQALQVISGRVLARDLNRSARRQTGEVRDLMLTEAATQARVAATMEAGNELVTDPRYRQGESVNVPLRLADKRNEHPNLVRLNPNTTEARGTEMTLQSSQLVGTTIPVAFAFLCGALAHAFPGRRRMLLPLGYVMAGIGLALAIVVELVHA